MDLEIMLTSHFRNAVEENIDRDPLQIALDNRVVHKSEVATQVKYLQRARRKLPSFYSARCLFTPIGFEQSSSEQTALHKQFTGHQAVDLTCGLGVDTFALSLRFNHVTSIEADPLAAMVARENMKRLGVKNVEIVNTTAEEYAGSMDKVDLIYADPDRRNSSNAKMVCLSDCRPNIEAMMPLLATKCKQLAVKLSPMFDVDEALRLFGKGAHAELVSVDSECKELLVDTSWDEGERRVSCSALGKGSFTTVADNRVKECNSGFEPDFKYLLIPDAALRQARLTDACYRQLGEVSFFNHHSYGFANRPIEGFAGNVYEIERIVPFKPKELKKTMARRIEYHASCFPFTAQEVMRSLGTSHGSQQCWAFTRIEDKLWAIEIKR